MIKGIQGAALSASQTASNDDFLAMGVVECDASRDSTSSTVAISVVSGLFYLGIGVFLFFTLSPIGVPGLYYDEVLFLPITLRALYGDQISVYSHIQFADVSVMIMPYLGALKAYLMAPVVLLMGSSVGSIRLPSILLGLANIVLLYRFLLPRLGQWAAAVTFLLLATDPVYAFHSKLDWGPTTLAHFFTVLLVISLWRYIETEEPKYLARALWVGVFGIFDKLNFLWLLVAYSVGFTVVFGPRIWRSMRKDVRSHLVHCLPQLLILSVMVVILVPAAKRLGLANPEVVAMGFVNRLLRVHQLFVLTFSGVSQFNWIFGILPTRNLPIPLLTAATALFGVPMALFGLWRRNSTQHETAILRLFLVTVVSGVTLFVELALTPEVGGSHHLALLWPIPQVLIGSGIAMGFTRGFGPAPIVKTGIPLVLGIGIGTGAITQNLRVATEFRGVAMAGKSFTPYFDPGLATVASELSRLDPDQIVSVDWGIAHPLLALLSVDRQKQFLDLGANFSHRVSPQEQEWLNGHILSQKKLAVVSYQHSLSPPSSSVVNFDDFSSTLGRRRVDILLPGQDPRNGYRISVFE